MQKQANKILVALIIVIIIVLALILPSAKNTSIQEKTLQGSSLSPLIKGGTFITIDYNYYQNKEIQRNDIVVRSYPGREGDEIIKIVKAIPGDKFELKQVGDNAWQIFINDKVLVNSQNQPYQINQSRYNLLRSYEKNYKNIIPGNAYFLLGDRVGGSLDSTRFGLISKRNILGKVIKY
jgi:signal peptidase I